LIRLLRLTVGLLATGPAHAAPVAKPNDRVIAKNSVSPLQNSAR